MPKSRSRTRARVIRAGLTTGVVAATLLVAPQAAWAAVTVTPTVVAAGGTVTIVDTTATFPDPSYVEVQTAACAAKYTAVSSAVIAVPSASINYDDIPNELEVTLPATVTAGTNGVTKRWNVCVYTSTSTTTSTRLGAYSINVGSVTTVSPTNGITGGGNTVTVTAPGDSPFLTGVTTVGAQFSSSPCPATYGTPAAGTSAPVTKISDYAASLTVPSGVTTTAAAGTDYELCLYNGTGTSGALLTVVNYEATLLSPSQPSGPAGGGNALTFTATTPIFAGITTIGVNFTDNAECATEYDASGTTHPTYTNAMPADADIRKLSDDRIAVKVPDLEVDDFLFCVYNGRADGTSPLMASSRYDGVTVQNVTSIVPASGPAIGGNRITVVGTDFPTTAGAISGTLGGTPLTGILPISSTAFTALAPAHVPQSNVVLVVTTALGQDVLTGAYTYQSSLQVTPNTAPNTAPVDVLVKGMGFQAVAMWGDEGEVTADEGHVYLVKGIYNDLTVGGGRANPPVAECINVLAFSDTELVCTLPLNARLNVTGTATQTAADAAVNNATTTTITVNSGSKLAVAGADFFLPKHVGMFLTHANVSGAAKILDVVNARNAVIATAGGAGTAADNDADIVANGLTNVPVPEGVYNMTFVNSPAADASTSSAYVQSVVSSGSTFTVSRF